MKKKLIGAAAAGAMVLGLMGLGAAPASAAPARDLSKVTWSCAQGYRPIYVMSYGNKWKACQNIKNPRLIYLTW